MQYNTEKPRLTIAEYGRHVQLMIEAAKKIEDKEQRTLAANAIVQVMSQFNPQQRDQADFKHKLWDHLFLISNFELEVDAPFSMPTAKTVRVHPDKPNYASNTIKFRHYGRIMEQLIEKSKKLEDPEVKSDVAILLANQMKKSYLMWNRDSVTDEIMALEIAKLSGGQLKLAEDLKLSHPNEAPVVRDLGRNKKRKKKNFRRKY
jgi:hypothetical protein